MTFDLENVLQPAQKKCKYYFPKIIYLFCSAFAACCFVAGCSICLIRFQLFTQFPFKIFEELDIPFRYFFC